MIPMGLPVGLCLRPSVCLPVSVARELHQKPPTDLTAQSLIINFFLSIIYSLYSSQLYFTHSFHYSALVRPPVSKSALKPPFHHVFSVKQAFSRAWTGHIMTDSSLSPALVSSCTAQGREQWRMRRDVF